MFKLNPILLPDNPNEVRMSFGEHLEDLRWRIVKALIGLGIGMTICIIFGGDIIKFLSAPLIKAMRAEGYPEEMISTGPTDLFMEYFTISLIFGAGISAPYILYQIW